MNSNFLKAQGAKILSELNDLKRTLSACAKETQIDLEDLTRVVKGEADLSLVEDCLNRICKSYPIDAADIRLIEDDSVDGIKLMRKAESIASTRFFQRKDRHNDLSDYYEYRDTVCSRNASFRPEWIRQIRVVNDSDPYNPDVIYNNGHFMHQMTFFVGPVNFYYELDGKKYCVEMNTGDSNYITPYWPHSFASRDANQTAYIVAVTFGAEVKRSHRELYNLGPELAKGFILTQKEESKSTQDLIDFHLANEKWSRNQCQKTLDEQNIAINILEKEHKLSKQDLEKIASLLSINPVELYPQTYRKEEEIIVKQMDQKQDSYLYPNSEFPAYRIHPLARCHKLPLLKGFNIEVLCKEDRPDYRFSSSLHQYIFNYSDAPIEFCWSTESNKHQTSIQTGDSLYIKPFISHSFFKQTDKEAKLVVIGISNSINSITQRELSSLANFERVIAETQCWFDEGK